MEQKNSFETVGFGGGINFVFAGGEGQERCVTQIKNSNLSGFWAVGGLAFLSHLPNVKAPLEIFDHSALIDSVVGATLKAK